MWWKTSSAANRELVSEPQIDSLARLREWARLTIERQRERGTEGGCVLGAPLAEGCDRWIDGLAAALRRIQEAGEIGPEGDPEKLATGLTAALHGGYTLAQAARDIAPMETAVFSMIDHIDSFR